VGLRVLGWFKVLLVGLPGIMEISGAGKQETVSELVERVRSKARAKRTAHLELFRVLRNGTTSNKEESECDGWCPSDVDLDEFGEAGSPNKGMVRCDKAEAARRHLKGGWNMVSNGLGNRVRNRNACLMDALFAQIFGSVLPANKEQKVSTCRHKRVPTIYKITSPSGKSYVGQTVWPTTRMCSHKHSSSKNTILAAAIYKYGWKHMRVQILRGGPNAVGGPVLEAELDGLETELIARHNTITPSGYNIQVGGKVAWRGCKGLSRHDERGPRSEETKQALRNTWEEKREARLSIMDGEEARRLRNHALKQSESRRAKQAGVFEDGRFKSSAARKATWEAKREAKLALLPPKEAAKKRAELERHRANAMRSYNRKKGRV
jgi:hypothetical protein